MKLIDITMRFALVEIDGTEWHMTAEEYHKMANWKFTAWPHNLKRINPQRRSCARCVHRPIDFTRDKQRSVLPEAGRSRKCPMGAWSRASPFYDNFVCKQGLWIE